MPLPWFGSMFVSTMKPQPALSLSAATGRRLDIRPGAADEHGAADEDQPAFAGHRRAEHVDAATPASSSAQPVTATSPATVTPLAGVSIAPKGAAGRVNVTPTVAVALKFRDRAVRVDDDRLGPAGSTEAARRLNPEAVNCAPWCAPTSARDRP